jgi:hypothetical protein
MEKSCENCGWKDNGCPITDGICNNLCMWKPDYHTLEQENVELTQALERACKTIAEICHWNSCHYDCPVSEGCSSETQEPECVERLVKHFKEATQ